MRSKPLARGDLDVFVTKVCGLTAILVTVRNILSEMGGFRWLDGRSQGNHQSPIRSLAPVENRSFPVEN